MEEKTKKPFRFNVIDVIILVVLLAIAAGLVYFFFFRGVGAKKGGTATIEYVIESTQVRDEFTDLIKVGDKLIDSSKQRKLGEVIGVEYEQATQFTVNSETGEQREVPYPERVNIYITVRTDATENEGKYQVDNSYDVFVGSYFSYRVPGFAGVGNCVSMKIIEK